MSGPPSFHQREALRQRGYRLPYQLARARRRVRQLEREAIERGMVHLLNDTTDEVQP